MNLLIWAATGAIIVISSQVAHDWRDDRKPNHKCQCQEREEVRSATHEQPKGMNGCDEPK